MIPSQRLRPILALTLCLSCALAGGGGLRAQTGSPTPASRPEAGPSLVLITVEGLRPDYLSCYGKGGGKPTPNIDRLAAEGRLFEQVVTPSVSSLPSLATLLTGKTPFQHAVWDDGYRNRLAAAEVTLAERLKSKGYRTAAFLGTSRAATGRGMDQGFDLYQDGYQPPLSGSWRLMLRSSKAVMGGALSWISSVGQGPFFLWLHLVDPTVPGPGTATQPTSNVAQSYADRVAQIDTQVGALLEALKKRDDYASLVIVLTADHGSGLGEHGETMAGIFAFDSTLRVPLIVRAGSAGAGKGVREARLCGLIDVYPTLERLLHLSPTPGLKGRDLLGPAPAHEPAYHAAALEGREVFGWAPSEVVAQGNYRLITGASPRLYDVAADPAQKQDLSASSTETVVRLKEVSRSLSGGAAIPPAHFLVGPAPGPTAATRLAKMGLVSPSLKAAGARPLPDPGGFKESLQFMEETHLRAEALGNSFLPRVRDLLLKTDPDSLFTLLGLDLPNLRKLADQELGQTKEMLAKAQRLYPLDDEVYHELGHVALQEKRNADAALLFTTALDLQPRYPAEVAYDLACAYARDGKKSEGVARLRDSIRLGFRDAAHIQSDTDLDPIRGEAAYKKLMQEEFPSSSGSTP